MQVYQLVLILILVGGCTAAEPPPPPHYLFYLHGFWLEAHTPEELHPQYGRYRYAEQLDNFRAAGLTVISEQRPPGTNAARYARRVAGRVDSLLAAGVPPENITIAGASKGGYIAQYVATYLRNPDLKFVFIASYRDEDLETLPGLDWCGAVLSIYEQSDRLGVAAGARHRASACAGTYFQEVVLATGLGHGFLFQPLPAWQEPLITFAKAKLP